MSVNTKVNGQLVKSAGLYKASVPIQSGDIYSFEERQIGVWADSKPLYQRTFDLGSDMGITNNAFTNTTIDASNMETLINAKAIYSTGATIYNVMANINNGVIRLQADRNDNAISARYITLQYTKTTDVAGSGIWTPSGDYAVHYTTDEQVIGTWIDGRTVYRKVVDLGTFPNATDKTVAHGISNFDMCLNISIFGKRTDGTNLLMPNVVTQSNNVSYQVGWGINTTNITISAGTDRSIYSGYAILEYIKTSS